MNPSLKKQKYYLAVSLESSWNNHIASTHMEADLNISSEEEHIRNIFFHWNKHKFLLQNKKNYSCYVILFMTNR